MNKSLVRLVHKAKTLLVVGDRVFCLYSKLGSTIQLEYWCCYVCQRSLIVFCSFLQSTCFNFISDSSSSFAIPGSISWAVVIEDFYWCGWCWNKSVSSQANLERVSTYSAVVGGDSPVTIGSFVSWSCSRYCPWNWCAVVGTVGKAVDVWTIWRKELLISLHCTGIYAIWSKTLHLALASIV